MTPFARLDSAVPVTEEHRLLLRALFDQDASAASSLTRWAGQVDFDALDPPSFRLVPAVFRRHASLRPEPAHFGRMKGIYRYFQYRNTLLLTQARQAVGLLQQQGIRPVLFGGIASALKYHRDPALRPMPDIDALVPPPDFRKAIDTLWQHGWTATPPELRQGFGASARLVHADQHGFEVHRHVLAQCADPELEREFVERARPFDWNGQEVRIMAPEDLVLVSLCKAMCDSDFCLAWMHDLVALLDAEPDFDVASLWDVATRFGLRRQVFDGLCSAADALPQPRFAALRDDILRRDRPYLPELATRLFAEGRSDCISPEHQAAVAMQIPDLAGEATERMAAASLLPGHPRHIRYTTDPHGHLRTLTLQRRHLPRVRELFRVRNRKALRDAMAEATWPFEGEIRLPDGVLTHPKRMLLPPWAYRASIEIETPATHQTLAPGARLRLRLKVRNRASRCWPCYGDRHMRFRLALDSLRLDTRQKIRDSLFVDLARRIPGRAAFIETGDAIALELDWIAPDQPGRYEIRFDIVHGRFIRFSLLGNRFPKIILDVVESATGATR